MRAVVEDTLSKSAADSFLNAIEKTRKEFEDEEAAHYKKFIDKGETPTKKDIETFDKLIKEYEGIASYYRTKVVNNMAPVPRV